MKHPACPLCHALDSQEFHTESEGIPWRLYRHGAQEEIGELRYFICDRCDFVFKDPKVRPEPSQEKIFYEQHENCLLDSSYLEFLRRLADPLTPYLEPGAIGLDYGCGKAPAMASIFRERGFNCDSYDPYFFPEGITPNSRYDFVTCSEVAEHFYDPGSEFVKIVRTLLKPEGWLAVMTTFRPSSHAEFSRWHYRRDPTHVGFYSQASFRWLAANLRMTLVIPAPNVALLRRLNENKFAGEA